MALKENSHVITTFDSEEGFEVGTMSTTDEGKFVGATIFDDICDLEDIDNMIDFLNTVKKYIEENGSEDDDFEEKDTMTKNTYTP